MLCAQSESKELYHCLSTTSFFHNQLKFWPNITDIHLAAAHLDPSQVGRAMGYLGFAYMREYDIGVGELPTKHDCQDAMIRVMDEMGLVNMPKDQLYEKLGLSGLGSDVSKNQPSCGSGSSQASGRPGGDLRCGTPTHPHRTMVVAGSSKDKEMDAQEQALIALLEDIPIPEEEQHDEFFRSARAEVEQFGMPFSQMDKAVQKKIGRYLEMPILEFWSQDDVKRVFPRMTLVARKLLPIMPTSCPAERMFSTGGYTVNNRRTRLSEDTINSLIFLGSITDAGILY